jgi:multidrug efflux system membrane fusion protein
MSRNRVSLLLSGLFVAATTVGCHQAPSQVSPPEPPVVPVSTPVKRDVTDYVDYTGRTDAVESVGIRARVTGYIERIPFQEGAEVKKGDILFEIDPRPYKAQLDQAQGQVELNQASLNLAKITYERDKPLAAKAAITQQQLDQDKAAVDEAEARIKAAQAAVEVYKLNLEFTQVISPIDGMVSRYYYTPGNLVIQDQTLLTTVVSLDPMYAYFDMDEPTLLRVKRAVNEGRIKLVTKKSDIPILMGLQGESGYPHRGSFNFINNVINPSTGTIAVRGVFPNPRPPNGTRLLVPGMFVRIRLPIGQPHAARLVIDRAVGSDQGLKFVYVVNTQNKIEYRRVTTGSLQDDGLRAIDDGLSPDDRVVTGGLQQVRPRMEVSPDEEPMPTLANVQGQPPPPVNNRAQPPPPGSQTNTQGNNEK